MKKVIGILILVVIGMVFAYGQYKAYRTALMMATNEENNIITGMWDGENLERYKYLAIPDADTTVKSFDIRRPFLGVTDIGEGAFEGNTYIETVYIPENIVRIGSNAFKGCTSIKAVSFGGTEQQWKQIVIESGNEALKTAPITYNAKMPKSKDI